MPAIPHDTLTGKPVHITSLNLGRILTPLGNPWITTHYGEAQSTCRRIHHAEIMARVGSSLGGRQTRQNVMKVCGTGLRVGETSESGIPRAISQWRGQAKSLKRQSAFWSCALLMK